MMRSVAFSRRRISFLLQSLKTTFSSSTFASLVIPVVVINSIYPAISVNTPCIFQDIGIHRLCVSDIETIPPLKPINSRDDEARENVSPQGSSLVTVANSTLLIAC